MNIDPIWKFKYISKMAIVKILSALELVIQWVKAEIWKDKFLDLESKEENRN